ncbi:S1 RNA-binding domain-containing protein [Candidatus Gracilibacteria bacterium]|nr:S1 RNA-binding domain-containing protein [Candidatus Gracilibacteria bacterium]
MAAEVETPAAEVMSEAETPVTAVEGDAPAEAVAEGEAPAAEIGTDEEGASFTPVAENENDRPRRLKDLEPGMELDGRVTSIALYGVFIDVGVGRDGLVHISEMSDTRIETPSDLVQIGDSVRVRIKSIDPDARRISLTMRSRERGSERKSRKRPEVDKDQMGNLKPGDTIEGTITGMAPFGAFADIGLGKDGLIHISELAEGRVEKPEDAVQVGEKYIFKVLEIDPDGTRISLSLRRAMRSQKMSSLENGQILDGTVSGIAPFGAFVDIGVGRDGLVHISALSDRRVEKVEDVVKVGDKVQVRVLEVDPQSKRISLTMRLTEPEASADEEGAAEQVGGTTRSTTSATARTDFSRYTAAAQAQRESREPRRDRDDRRRKPTAPVMETYSTEDITEEFEGDATLEDLLSKYGGTNRRDKGVKRREDEVEEEDDEDRVSRRQRDAIRRTLQQVGSDD